MNIIEDFIVRARYFWEIDLDIFDIMDWLIRGHGAQSDCKKIVSFTVMANGRMQFTYLYIYFCIWTYVYNKVYCFNVFEPANPKEIVLVLRN